MFNVLVTSSLLSNIWSAKGIYGGSQTSQYTIKIWLPVELRRRYLFFDSEISRGGYTHNRIFFSKMSVSFTRYCQIYGRQFRYSFLTYALISHLG
jgi:hypothetical protein